MGRQSRQVSIGDLTVADDSGQVHLVESDLVAPQLVVGVRGDTDEHLNGIPGCGTEADGEPHQGALGYGASCETILQIGEPRLGRLMMDVVNDGQGDQEVSVEEDGHASSSKERTSSLVTGRPSRSVRKPVDALVVTEAVPDVSSADRRSRATASLSVMP